MMKLEVSLPLRRRPTLQLSHSSDIRRRSASNSSGESAASAGPPPPPPPARAAEAPAALAGAPPGGSVLRAAESGEAEATSGTAGATGTVLDRMSETVLCVVHEDMLFFSTHAHKKIVKFKAHHSAFVPSRSQVATVDERIMIYEPNTAVSASRSAFMRSQARRCPVCHASVWCALLQYATDRQALHS